MKAVDYIFVFVLIIFSLNVIAQDNDSPSLEAQFEEILSESESYKIYKVVPRTMLNKYKSNINDTIAGIKQELEQTRVALNQEKQQIQSLNNQLSETNNTLNTVTEQKDAINFLGIPLSKSKYKTIMWSIVGALLASMLFFFYRFYRSNGLTRDTQKSFDELQDEFDNYRKRAIEKEQKIMRRLQDELNKN